jgi:hypothetical protein
MCTTQKRPLKTETGKYYYKCVFFKEGLQKLKDGAVNANMCISKQAAEHRKENVIQIKVRNISRPSDYQIEVTKSFETEYHKSVIPSPIIYTNHHHCYT